MASSYRAAWVIPLRFHPDGFSARRLLMPGWFDGRFKCGSMGESGAAPQPRVR
ncbi:MAG: hypothetical protein IT444_12605 [Phycisphaeraceae bacterium]|nr:hypothetical protein [Phycisphaeraceae bacterium]